MTAFLYILLLLASHHGQVLFDGIPVPGATVTATQGNLIAKSQVHIRPYVSPEPGWAGVICQARVARRRW